MEGCGTRKTHRNGMGLLPDRGTEHSPRGRLEGGKDTAPVRRFFSDPAACVHVLRAREKTTVASPPPPSAPLLWNNPASVLKLFSQQNPQI